jgi:transcriptional regulator with XRE-family HTH domain
MRRMGTKWGAAADADDDEGVKIPADSGYNRSAFVSALRSTRASRKLNVADMAAHLGVGRAFLAELERGETDPTWEVLQLIRDKLHWTDFGGTEEVIPVPYSRFADLQNRAARLDANLRNLEQARARISQLEARIEDLEDKNDQLREALREAAEALEEGA